LDCLPYIQADPKNTPNTHQQKGENMKVGSLSADNKRLLIVNPITSTFWTEFDLHMEFFRHLLSFQRNKLYSKRKNQKAVCLQLWILRQLSISK